MYESSCLCFRQPLKTLWEREQLHINVHKKINTSPVFEWIENIMGKGENASYRHFLLFLQCFKRTYSAGSLSKQCVVTG